MTIAWTDEEVTGAGLDGHAAQVEHVRAAARWRVRVLSDRAVARADGTAWSQDFGLMLDDQFRVWVRPFGQPSAYARVAHAGGVALEIVQDITRGIVHQVAVRTKPSDETRARWQCTCGVGSRGEASPEAAQIAAEAHVEAAVARGVAPRDRAVCQDAAGAWAQRDVAVVRRIRACVRSDLSVVRSHRTGYGEEFELVIDGRLGLWVRGLGAETALRKDEDGRGVALLVLEGA